MKPFRWCFIGAGTLAKKVAKLLLASEDHEIVSVYTRRFEKGEEFAKKYGGKAYDNAADAMKDPNVDGVYIVTPHNSHYEYGKLAMSLKKPTLLEKPFTVNAKQSEELIRLSKENDTYLAEAMWTWFAKAPNEVKKWVEDGEFGKIESCFISFNMNNQHYAPRVSDPKKAGGALLDIGVYPITYAYRLFGYPKSIECVGVLKNGIDLKETIKLVFPGMEATKVTLTSSIVDFKGLEQLKLVGEKAKLHIWGPHCNGRATLKKKQGKSIRFQGPAGYLHEFNVAAKEIASGLKESPMVPLSCTLDVMKIMDECRRQMGLVYDCEGV